MLPMYETRFHLATIDSSGITAFAQLAGRKVGVGPKGGANELIFTQVRPLDVVKAAAQKPEIDRLWAQAVLAK